MFIRQAFVTNSSSSNFMIVIKDKLVTKEFLKKVGLDDFVWHSDYVGTYSVTLDDMVRCMNPSDWEKEHPEDARFIDHYDMEEIVDDIGILIPEAIRYKDRTDPRLRFYDEWVDEKDVDLYATYQALLDMGYTVTKYEASDECGGINTAMDMMTNRTYVSEDTKEFIVKSSRH